MLQLQQEREDAAFVKKVVAAVKYFKKNPGLVRSGSTTQVFMELMAEGQN